MILEIEQYLVDRLRERTSTDYINVETRIDSLPGDVVIDVLEEAVEHFIGSGEGPATVADLAEIVASSVKMTTLVGEPA